MKTRQITDLAELESIARWLSAEDADRLVAAADDIPASTIDHAIREFIRDEQALAGIELAARRLGALVGEAEADDITLVADALEPEEALERIVRWERAVDLARLAAKTLAAPIPDHARVLATAPFEVLAQAAALG